MSDLVAGLAVAGAVLWFGWRLWRRLRKPKSAGCGTGCGCDRS